MTEAGNRGRRRSSRCTDVARARSPAVLAVCVLAFAAAIAPGLAAEQEAPASPAAEPLVYLRDVDASILQDIRYAGPNNFTGRRVPGYAAAECMLLGEVARALARVQAGLLQRNLSLKVYDCYRPRRAVRAFAEWVKDPAPDPLLKRYYPSLDRSQLIELGYIAAVSGHSRGNTVDVTLVALPARKAQPYRMRAVYGPCDGPPKTRSPDNSVDMGTSFDCFDPLSHTRAAGLAPRQQRWRQRLLDAMAAEGFHNYQKEWWHFTYEPQRWRRSYDVPIEPR